jgi:hypothetical protein
MTAGDTVRPTKNVLFNGRGLPWTVGLSLGWTIILTLFSGGVLFVPLGFYLAYWVRTRQGRSAAFWCYLIVVVISILALLVPSGLALYMYPIAAGGLVLMVAAPLALRAEIISLYRRSWGISLPINPLLTILFSSVYLNYSVPDLPVTPISPATVDVT